MPTRLHRELLKSPLARKGVGCLTCLLLIVATLTGYASWKRLRNARATSSWTNVTGTIERAGVEETWSNGQTQFIPRLAYRFEYQGKAFSGERIGLDEESYPRRAAAEEAIAEFAVGTEVSVYFDPSDATRSVLHPGARSMDYLLLGLPLLFFLFAYGFFQMIRRAKAEQEAAAGGEGGDESAG